MDVYILAGARTPGGSFLGALAQVAAPALGAQAIRAALERSGVEAEEVGEVLMGQAIQAGCGQAPARQAALGAGLPDRVPCSTINKLCGSGMQAIISAAGIIALGENRPVVAGGMENMSRAPHLLAGARRGLKFGDGQLKDSMLCDGLVDAYSGRSMGQCAEECVAKYDFSREELDEFAIASFNRANRAMEEGAFDGELVAVQVGDVQVDKDEGPSRGRPDKIPKLKPAFAKDGRITAANASTLNDGAAALVLSGPQDRERAKFKIVAWAGFAQQPLWFTTAPVGAMKKCLDKANLSVQDIDLFEINEAFAAVTLAAMRELDLDHQKVNIYGGAISLGHPLGCSGARIVVTLMSAMQARQAKYGMASLCIGGGEGLAMIVERL